MNNSDFDVIIGIACSNGESDPEKATKVCKRPDLGGQIIIYFHRLYILNHTIFISTYMHKGFRDAFDDYLQYRVWDVGMVAQKSKALQQSRPRHKPKFNLKGDKYKIGNQKRRP